MRIAYLTAGAAGMYCGSCMHDNALARALIEQGHDCLLVPIYTPIRTDEPTVSEDHLFFGGINVFLQQKVPLLGALPRPILRLLDSPWLLRWATRRAASTSAKSLGGLTVSMLRGTAGHQAGEVRRLVAWLADDFKPDAIIFSNLLIGGCIPEIRRRMDAKILVWLQGDDIFLDHLPTPYREQATEQMRVLARQADACLVNSRFYAEKMGERLEIPADRLKILPLAIHASPFLASAPPPARSADSPVRIGYFARLAPEKGFHLLVDAFARLSNQLGPGRVELHYAGWLGEHNRAYFDENQRKLNTPALAAHHRHHGSPDFQGKIDFLHSLDLLCVPTVYEEPKGLFVLESLACRIPVVQPAHGAFPELLSSTGGGRLFEPGRADQLTEALAALAQDRALREQLGEEGHAGVKERHSIERQASSIDALLRDIAS